MTPWPPAPRPRTDRKGTSPTCASLGGCLGFPHCAYCGASTAPPVSLKKRALLSAAIDALQTAVDSHRTT